MASGRTSSPIFQKGRKRFEPRSGPPRPECRRCHHQRPQDALLLPDASSLARRPLPVLPRASSGDHPGAQRQHHGCPVLELTLEVRTPPRDLHRPDPAPPSRIRAPSISSTRSGAAQPPMTSTMAPAEILCILSVDAPSSHEDLDAWLADNLPQILQEVQFECVIHCVIQRQNSVGATMYQSREWYREERMRTIQSE
ncbi:uncharacterized protein LOC119272430 [Triticum dicoccoides]|uniref:uncharacterized protein LOC119272430 n=1 Tax=Triticum dicoccoides TaxID=85692 RepID=UPI00188EE885|nr:uncharacterized protein LOC119272430 [Triticum dicoccoides]